MRSNMTKKSSGTTPVPSGAIIRQLSHDIAYQGVIYPQGRHVWYQPDENWVRPTDGVSMIKIHVAHDTVIDVAPVDLDMAIPV